MYFNGHKPALAVVVDVNFDYKFIKVRFDEDNNYGTFTYKMSDLNPGINIRRVVDAVQCRSPDRLIKMSNLEKRRKFASLKITRFMFVAVFKCRRHKRRDLLSSSFTKALPSIYAGLWMSTLSTPQLYSGRCSKYETSTLPCALLAIASRLVDAAMLLRRSAPSISMRALLSKSEYDEAATVFHQDADMKQLFMDKRESGDVDVFFFDSLSFLACSLLLWVD
jgi:hypothetical protein